MRAYLERALRAAVAAATAVLCSMSPAQAAFYSGAWDPQFGLPFEGGADLNYNLGWKGNVVVEVPDPCIRASGVVLFFFPNNCGVAGGPALTPTMVSASVQLYELEGNPIADLTYEPASLIQILALRFANGKLDGLLTLPSEWMPATLPTGLSSPVEITRYFSLWFVLPGVSTFLSPFSSEIPSRYNGPLLLSHPLDLDEVTITWQNKRQILEDLSISDVEQYAPTTYAFALIPEPSSLALVALALLATGWVARSRRPI